MNTPKTFSQILHETGQLIYTTRGVSMYPLLRQRKDIVVIETPKEHCKKYDTVLFLRANGKYVLHRILRDYGNTFWIVGDNCTSGEMVREDQIIGVMKSVKRGGRTIHVTDWHYRLYTHIWCDVYPVRFLLLRVKAFVWQGLRFVKRRLFG